MLYNFESKTLEKQSVLNEVSIIVENLCDEFSLENHFATISLTLHELLSLMIRHDEKEKTEYFIDSIIESGEIAFQIRTENDLKFLEKELLHSEEGTIIMALSDEVEIREFRDMPLTAEYKNNSRGLGLYDMVKHIEDGTPFRASSDLLLHVLEVMTGFERAYERKAFAEINTKPDRPMPL